MESIEQNRFRYYTHDSFHMDINEAGGHVFLHLEVEKWNKKILEEIRMLVELVSAEYKHKGYCAVFATADNKKTVKFWNLIKKCDFVENFSNGGKKYYLGAWIVDED